MADYRDKLIPITNTNTIGASSSYKDKLIPIGKTIPTKDMGAINNAMPGTASSFNPATLKTEQNDVSNLGKQNPNPTFATGRFGQTTGQVFAAKEGIQMFNEAVKSHNDVSQNILTAIENAKSLGQPVDRLEEILKEHQASSPNINTFLGEKANTLIQTPKGQATRQVLGEALGTIGDITAVGGLSGVGSLKGLASLATERTVPTIAQSIASTLPSSLSSDVGRSLEKGKVTAPVNTILSTITPFGIAGLGKGVQAVQKILNVASPQQAEKAVSEVVSNLESFVGSGINNQKRLKMFQQKGSARFLLENGYIPEVKDSKIFVDDTRKTLQKNISDLSSEAVNRANQDNSLFGKVGIISGIRNAIKSSGDVKGTALESALEKMSSEAQSYLKQIGQGGEQVGTEGLLKLRQFFDELAQSTFDPIKKTFTAEGLAARNTADYLREIIRNKVKDKTLAEVLKLEGDLIGADRFLESIGGRAVKGGRLGTMLARLGGGIAANVAVGGGVPGILASAVGQEIGGQSAKLYGKLSLIGPLQKLKIAKLAPGGVLQLLEAGKIDEAIARRLQQKLVGKTLGEAEQVIAKELPQQLSKFQQLVQKIAVDRNMVVDKAVTGKVYSAEDILKLAPDAKNEIDALSDSIAKKFRGAKVAKANIKRAERIIEKAMNEEGGNFNNIRDAARNTIISEDSGEDIPKIIKELEKTIGKNKDISIKKQEADKFMGYSGNIINYRTKNGLMAEIQVNTPRMIYAKDSAESSRKVLGDALFEKMQNRYGQGGLGHKYYEYFRSLTDVEKESTIGQEIINKSKTYYSKFNK